MLIVRPTWFASCEAPEPFTVLNHDVMCNIMENFDHKDAVALALSSKSMFTLLKIPVDMFLCQAALSGLITLTYVEHIPLINRIRQYFPDYEPSPCDYGQEEKDEDLYYSDDDNYSDEGWEGG